MPPIRPLVAVTLLALASACALSHDMPPFSATRSYATTATPRPSTPPTLPAPRVFQHGKHINLEYDQGTDQTRISVTTHRGTYFLWIQHPRLTFFYVYAGTTLAQTPASVFLIFRTQHPQLPLNNRLTLVCDSTRQELAIAPTFWLEPGVMTTSRHYMYELPMSRFVEVVACGNMSIAVGDVSAPFANDQPGGLTGLRRWPASRMSRGKRASRLTSCGPEAAA